MFSSKIIKMNLKMNKKFLIAMSMGIGALMGIYLSIYPYFDEVDLMDQILSALPENLKNGLGLSSTVDTVNAFLIMEFYHTSFIYLFIAFVVVFANRLIAGQIEDTSLVYFLSSEISRKQFFISQVLVLNIGIIMFGFMPVLLGGIPAYFMYDSTEFIVSEFLIVNTSITLLFMFIGSICLGIGAFTKSTSKVLGYSATFVIVQFTISFISKMASSVESLKYGSIFTLYDLDRVVTEPKYFVTMSMVFIVGSIIVHGISLKKFIRRDLNI